MLFNRAGCVSSLGRRLSCIWVAAFCLCLVVAPLAFSQKAKDTTKQPDNLEKIVSTQDTNDRIAQLTQVQAAEQGDYPIGDGDVLSIEVFDVPELSRDVRVNDAGFISLPLLPVKVRATGLTSYQLQDKLAELLQTNGLVNNAQVTVGVKERHGEPITVIGAVKTPQVIQAVQPMSLLQVLSQVGGIADDAGSTILITRAAPPASPDEASAASAPPQEPVTTTIDINDLLDSGDIKLNIKLLGGDVVRVPRAGVVYAVGAVQHPGGFVMESDRQHMTVLKLISLSGGLSTSAKGQNAVLLRQDVATGTRQQTPVNVSKILTLKSEDIPLTQSDILYVPDSAGKKAWHQVAQIAVGAAIGAAVFRVIQ